MKELNDLVEGAKNNNSKAQMELYKRYSKAMFTTAMRIVKNEHLAEDVVQEAFLVAFQKLSSLKEQVSFGAWLKKIVVNKSIEVYRKENKTFEVGLSQILESKKNISSLEDPPPAEIDTRKLVETIGKLPENQKYILTLSLVEGYDNEEISEIIGVSEAKIKDILNKAKESFRKNYGQKTVFTQKKNVEKPQYWEMPCEIFIDPGNASVEDIQELFSSLSELNKALGGKGLLFANSSNSVVLKTA